MVKNTIEIECESLGDLLENPNSIVEGLINILDPDSRCADEVKVAVPVYVGRYRTVTFRRIPHSSGEKAE